MKSIRGVLHVSATNLAKHVGCRHLTELDRRVAEGILAAPMWRDPALTLLQKRGLAHEEAYVADLKNQGRQVVGLRDVDAATASERTVQAMRDGADVVAQADLGNGRWSGRADLLLRVEKPSERRKQSYGQLAATLRSTENWPGRELVPAEQRHRPRRGR